MENLFEKYLKGPAFELNSEVLDPDYMPPELLHREPIMKFLSDIVYTSAINCSPSHVFIYGQTGTGKTTMVKRILKDMAEADMKTRRGLDWEIKASYCDCFGKNEQGILHHAGRELATEWNVPETGLTTAQLTERLQSGLAAPGIAFFALDSVDCYVKKQGDEVIRRLLDLNETAATKLSLIFISNEDIRRKLDHRTASRLGEVVPIFCPQYRSGELHDVLKKRAESALVDNSVEITDAALQYCAAKSAQHGDARQAINNLKRLLWKAQADGNKAITEEYAIDIGKKEKEKITPVIKNLSIGQQMLLRAVCVTELKYNGLPLTRDEIERAYRSQAPGLRAFDDIDPLISDLICVGILESCGKHYRGAEKLDIRTRAHPTDVLKMLDETGL